MPLPRCSSRLQRAAHDLAGADPRPVVGHEIDAPGHVAPGGEVVLDRGLPQQAGNAEEIGDPIGIAERSADRREAVLDLARGAVDAHAIEREGVVLAVVGERVAFRIAALDQVRVGVRHAADHEEGGLHAFAREHVEDVIGVRRQRAVVEGDDHFVVVERQRLSILEGADEPVLGRVHRNGAAGAESARIAGAVGRDCRCS